MSKRFVGASVESLKKYPELLPVWACIIAGAGLATFYTLRLAIRNPDVSWNKANNKEPWQEYSTKQYKFVDVSPLQTGPQSPAPKF